jgi:plastocyanin
MGIRGRSLSLALLALVTVGVVGASAQPGSGGGSSERPSASFTFSPANPVVGETVTFTSTSEATDGSITEVQWDFDGDGEFDDAEGTPVMWSFAAPGAHTVQLRVRQSNGKRGTSFADVVVAPPPVAPTPPPDGALSLMSPFPVIRIAGTVLQRAADVRILAVRGAPGARVRARCSGVGCPVASVARTLGTTRRVRLRKFERRLRAGITLQLFVRQPAKIGKYTRFAIRAGRPPARVDRCLMPGRTRPIPCP